MKQKFLLPIIILFFGTQIFAQDVPEEQRTLLTKISATWCPPCGAWGWDMFKDLVTDNEDKAVLIVAHHSGDLVNTAASEITTNFSVFNQPVFIANHTNQNISSSNASTKRTELKDMVEDAFANTAPIANSGMNLILDGDQLQVDVKSKFFQDADGEFYIAAYVVESEIVNFQESIGNGAIHEKVLRTAVTSTTFGELLINGAVTMNTEFNNSFSMTLDSDWNVNHLEIISIVWEKVDNKYQVVNTNISSNFEAPTASVDVLLQTAELKVFPTVTTSDALVAIDVKENLENASLELFDLNGRKIADIFQGNLNTGNTTFTINKNMVNTNGIYFVILRSDGKVVSQKVVFE